MSYINNKFDLFITAEENNLIFWEYPGGKIIKSIEDLHDDNIFSIVSLSKDRIATAGLDRKVNVITLKNGKTKTFSTDEKNEKVTSSILSMVGLYGDKLATCSHSGNDIRIWNLKGRKLKTLRGHKDIVNKLSYFEKNKLISSGDDGNVILWDYKKGNAIKKWKDHQDSILSVDLNSVNQFFVSGSEDKTIKIYSLKEKKCVRTCKGHKFPVTAIKILPESLNIASADSSGEMRLWDLKTGDCILNFNAHRGYIWDLEFVDNLVVSCSKSAVKFWNREGNCRRSFERMEDVYSMLFLKRVKK